MSIEEELREYLESWDCEVNDANMIRVTKERVYNLASYLNPDARFKGIAFEDGITVGEFVSSCIKELHEYTAFLIEKGA